MTRKLNFSIVIIVFFAMLTNVHSQFLPSLALAGGFMAGWHFNPVKNLNAELKNAGFPEMSESGFFTTGGGGFVDFPIKGNFLRIGGFGNGFTSKQTKQYSDTVKKDANYSMGQGGLFIEYVIPLGKIVDFSFGTQLATGTLQLELFQYGSGYGNYNTIFGELQQNGSSTNLSRTFKSRFYSVQPQVSIGILARKFLYFKIDAGYQLSAHNKWRVDNDVEVQNFPAGIEAKGFVINVGINFGLFIKD